MVELTDLITSREDDLPDGTIVDGIVTVTMDPAITADSGSAGINSSSRRIDVDRVPCSRRQETLEKTDTVFARHISATGDVDNRMI